MQTCCPAFGALILLFMTMAYSSEYHYTLRELQSFRLPRNKVWLVDINNDGIDEIVTHEEGRKLNVSNIRGKIFFSTFMQAYSMSHIGVIPGAGNQSVYIYSSTTFQDSIVCAATVSINFIKNERHIINKNVRTYYRQPQANVGHFQDRFMAYVATFHDAQ